MVKKIHDGSQVFNGGEVVIEKPIMS
jgi:hypothetical protein